jgi:hypothetical protein
MAEKDGKDSKELKNNLISKDDTETEITDTTLASVGDKND